ncbi:hypothetical protein [uncultured Methylobacterium sp.]|jgi:hypothetical protein|uniref:hypothetical protein n=1 Tax=uncultured Methylobacterium sp. TaxID=157278 RepID=UPI00262423E6|nr:hypothetical protein [uncultured Methylobacterium sp.]
MPRPREAVADAVRTARIIVMEEGAALSAAASSGDPGAVDAAGRNLATRIAQAILDAERDAVERVALAWDEDGSRHLALTARFAS